MGIDIKKGAIEKNGEGFFIPRWFFEKNQHDITYFAKGQVRHGFGGSFEEFVASPKSIKKSSEKAILVEIALTWWSCWSMDISKGEWRTTKYSMWVPKSVLLTEAEFIKSEEERKEREAAREAKREAAYQAALDKGIKYNEYLRDLAKSNGVKLGNAKRTDTIKDILDSKGIAYLSKQDFAA